MGQTLRYYGFILSPRERTAQRGVVSAAKGHQIGLSACTAAFHTGCRLPGYLHDETVLPGLSIGISDDRDPGGNTAALIRRQHNFVIQGSETAARILSGMMDIFSDCYLRGLRAFHRGGIEVCWSFSDIDRGALCSIPGSTVGE